MRLNSPEVPDECIQFAKDVGELAKKLGIKHFKLEFGEYSDKTTICFSTTDRRGRECLNLSIAMDVHHHKSIVYTPESSN